MWEKLPEYKISFDWNYGNSGQIASINAYEGLEVTLPSEGFYKTGYQLAGWNTQMDGNGTSYQLGQTVSDLNNCQNVKLYAVWEANKYSIIFNANGGTVSPSSKEVTYDQPVGELPVPVAANGAEFLGWYDGDTKYEATTIYTLTNNLSLKARWSEVAESLPKLPKVTVLQSTNRIISRRETFIMDCEDEDAEIYYTCGQIIIGSQGFVDEVPVPDKATGLRYEGAVSIDFSLSTSKFVQYWVIKAVAIKEGYEDSDVTIKNIVVSNNPEYDYGSGLIVEGLAESYDFTGKPIMPIVKVFSDGYELVAGRDYTVSYKNNTKVTTPTSKASIIIKGKGNYTGTATKTFDIVDNTQGKIALSKLSIKPVAVNVEDLLNHTSSGLLVKYGKEVLVEGIDYTVELKTSYYGEYIDGALPGNAYAILTGMGRFTGTSSLIKLKTNKYDISLDKAGLGLYLSTYTGYVNEYGEDYVPYAKSGAKMPQVSVAGGFASDDGTYIFELAEKKDFTVKYSNNKEIGYGTITVTGKGNYTGTITRTFRIDKSPLDKMSMSVDDVTFAQKKYNWKTTPKLLENGKALSTKVISFTYAYTADTTVLDYTTKTPVSVLRKAGEEVKTTDCVPAGTRIKVTARPIDDVHYSGEQVAYFRVATASLKKAKATIPTYVFDSSSFAPNKLNMTITVNGIALNSSDYDIVSYANNVNAGKATVTVRGKGNYGGIKTFTFKINKKDINQ